MRSDRRLGAGSSRSSSTDSTIAAASLSAPGSASGSTYTPKHAWPQTLVTPTDRGVLVRQRNHRVGLLEPAAEHVERLCRTGDV